MVSYLSYYVRAFGILELVAYSSYCKGTGALVWTVESNGNSRCLPSILVRFSNRWLVDIIRVKNKTGNSEFDLNKKRNQNQFPSSLSSSLVELKKVIFKVCIVNVDLSDLATGLAVKVDRT